MHNVECKRNMQWITVPYYKDNNVAIECLVSVAEEFVGLSLLEG